MRSESRRHSQPRTGAGGGGGVGGGVKLRTDGSTITLPGHFHQHHPHHHHQQLQNGGSVANGAVGSGKMRHSTSSPATECISRSVPASILKDTSQKAQSEKPCGYKEMRKGRRISDHSPGSPSNNPTPQRVTFDSSLPSMSNSPNVIRAFDVETAALRSLRNRRTSLPVSTQTEAPSSNISEARGLVVDMLANRDLSPNVATCLRAVAQLLNTQSSSVHNFNLTDLGLPRVVENPYSGEQLVVATASKPRVSNITFSTVTSATGLPTIAAEPSRPRSSSYWKPEREAVAPTHKPAPGEHTATAGGSQLLGTSTSATQLTCPSPNHSPAPASPLSRSRQASPNPDSKPPVSVPPCSSSGSGISSSSTGASASSTTPAPATTVAHAGPVSVVAAAPPALLASIPSTSGTAPLPITITNNNNNIAASAITPSSQGAVLASSCRQGIVCTDKSLTGFAVGSAPGHVTFGLPEDESEESTVSGSNSMNSALRVADGTVYDRAELERDATLQRVSEWSFPIFHVAEKYKHTVLSRMSWAVFKEADLFRIFKLSPQKFFNFFHALERGYWEIPYHNRIHAADVLHGCFYLTCHPVRAFTGRPASPELSFAGMDSAPLPIAESMSTLELMALFTAAAMHDYDHPGRTNAFLVASEDKKAILYNDRSVLENHHAAESWRLLCQRENYFIETLDSAEIKRFRYLVLEYILATDLKQHFDIIMQFNDKAADMDLSNEADRVLVSQTLIKFADINSPAKPYTLHRQWTERICQEFYEQGDEEKRRQMSVSPYMDRNEPDVAKLQDSFIAHIVNPLAVALNEAGLLPILPGLEEPELIINLKHNHQKWLLEIEAQTASTATPVDMEDPVPVPFPSHAHAPSMSCLPEEESEDSSNNSVIMNNNLDDFTAPAKKASLRTNGVIVDGELQLTIEDSAPTPVEPAAATVGRFEKKLGVSKRYLANVLKYLPSHITSHNSSNTTTSSSASSTANSTPKLANKSKNKNKSAVSGTGAAAGAPAKRSKSLQQSARK